MCHSRGNGIEGIKVKVLKLLLRNWEKRKKKLIGSGDFQSGDRYANSDRSEVDAWGGGVGWIWESVMMINDKVKK